jgi:glycosyltransferase involved in cell wall biosynthesis
MPVYERPLAELAKLTLRRVDRNAARRVNLFIASSRTVAGRIAESYGRDSIVVYPPVETARFTRLVPRDNGYFLIVSRLNAYKRIDYVIEACNRARLPLVIVGTGPWERRLREQAGPTVRLAGALPDRDVEELVSSCTALILPGEEDFGLTAVEAMAAGRPVIALGRGGATETVIDGVTGVLYPDPTPESFTLAADRLRDGHWEPDAARQRASLFDRARFEERFDDALRIAVDAGAGAFN